MVRISIRGGPKRLYTGPKRPRMALTKAAQLAAQAKAAKLAAEVADARAHCKKLVELNYGKEEESAGEGEFIVSSKSSTLPMSKLIPKWGECVDSLAILSKGRCEKDVELVKKLLAALGRGDSMALANRVLFPALETNTSLQNDTLVGKIVAGVQEQIVAAEQLSSDPVKDACVGMHSVKGNQRLHCALTSLIGFYGEYLKYK